MSKTRSSLNYNDDSETYRAKMRILHKSPKYNKYYFDLLVGYDFYAPSDCDISDCDTILNIFYERLRKSGATVPDPIVTYIMHIHRRKIELLYY